eukprot:SAG25_NODE_2216_length_1829_cov_1.345665_1_plen_269_part_10
MPSNPARPAGMAGQLHSVHLEDSFAAVGDGDGPAVFRCVARAAVTAAFDIGADEPPRVLHFLEAGQFVVLHEVRRKRKMIRGRTDHGWVSIAAQDGTLLLEALSMPLPRGTTLPPPSIVAAGLLSPGEKRLSAGGSVPGSGRDASRNPRARGADGGQGSLLTTQIRTPRWAISSESSSDDDDDDDDGGEATPPARPLSARDHHPSSLSPPSRRGHAQRQRRVRGELSGTGGPRAPSPAAGYSRAGGGDVRGQQRSPSPTSPSHPPRPLQ